MCQSRWIMLEEQYKMLNSFLIKQGLLSQSNVKANHIKSSCVTRRESSGGREQFCGPACNSIRYTAGNK